MAILLHKLPHEIDAAPFLDIADVVEVQRGERMYYDLERAKRR